MDWLKQIAPTVAAALGGPLSGIAISALSKVVGVEEDKVHDLLTSGKMTPEQIAAVKIAEIELKKQENELGLNFEKLAVDDRKSAREMQMTTRSLVPPILAGAITVGFFGILITMLVLDIKPSEPLLIMLGALGAAFGAVVNFWLGSSNGSQVKTDALARKL